VRYKELADEPCSITRPLVVFGDSWTLLILKYAFIGVRRFNAFHAALGVSRSRLQDRLDRLVEHDILAKQKSDEGAHEEYRLTAKGHALYPVLMAVKDWGDTYMAPDGVPVHYRHQGCGGDAHVRLECGSCGSELTARDIAVSPGPGFPTG
jgi:DNA-binding HxlR family transcriptional regulator